jgi:hypothetical protein
MIRPITVEGTIHFHRRGRGARKEIRTDEKAETPQCSAGRVPRISRFMALAIRFEQLIQAGEIIDYAELARLGHVTRARITQVMNLRLLAPDIQEQLLFLPLIARGHSSIHLRHLQHIAAIADWRKQRKMWQQYRKDKANN